MVVCSARILGASGTQPRSAVCDAEHTGLVARNRSAVALLRPSGIKRVGPGLIAADYTDNADKDVSRFSYLPIRVIRGIRGQSRFVGYRPLVCESCRPFDLLLI